MRQLLMKCSEQRDTALILFIYKEKMFRRAYFDNKREDH